jgi:hypothetical protein
VAWFKKTEAKKRPISLRNWPIVCAFLCGRPGDHAVDCAGHVLSFFIFRSHSDHGHHPPHDLGLGCPVDFHSVLFFLPMYFSKQLSALKSISLSTKFVRISSMATTVFLTLAVALSYGLDLLWSTPPADNWLFALGILGHAFISSGFWLPASSIIAMGQTGWKKL